MEGLCRRDREVATLLDEDNTVSANRGSGTRRVAGRQRRRLLLNRHRSRCANCVAGTTDTSTGSSATGSGVDTHEIGVARIGSGTFDLTTLRSLLGAVTIVSRSADQNVHHVSHTAVASMEYAFALMKSARRRYTWRGATWHELPLVSPNFR